MMHLHSKFWRLQQQQQGALSIQPLGGRGMRVRAKYRGNLVCVDEMQCCDAIPCQVFIFLRRTKLRVSLDSFKIIT
jgi:hypothetical protein